MLKKNEIDFTRGPLVRQMIIYALPIIGVNMLQLLFTATDVAMLGIFTNDMAVAAVGASANIINLLLGFLMGMSVATNVLVARAMGSKDKEGARRFVGTSIAVSVVFGLVITVVGFLLSEKMLIWTNCDPDVLPYADKYLKIYLLGTPVIMLYNFCASILRAVGDTLRPLIFLLVSGFANMPLILDADNKGGLVRELYDFLNEHDMTCARRGSPVDESGKRIPGKMVDTEGRRFDDGICLVTFGVDVHKLKTDDTTECSRGYRAKPYHIPYRALLPKGVKNLMLAGGCISGDFYPHASYRVMGNMAATGEAAGYAAAKSAEAGIYPSGYDGRLVREFMKSKEYEI